MISEYRKREILKVIEEQGIVQISELAEICGVSEATIRRDLNSLDKEGAVRRTHGGAISFLDSSQEQPHRKKLELMKLEKMRIAQAAANMISDGESIFLDSGTTTQAIAKHLERYKNLTVITNNTSIIPVIKLHESSHLVITGGMMRVGFNVLVGPTTEVFLKSIKIDKVFIGADAVDPRDGLYNSSLVELMPKQLSVRCGRRRFLVTDSSKFGNKGLIKVCNLDEFDYIITDDGLSEESVATIKEVTLKPEIILV